MAFNLILNRTHGATSSTLHIKFQDGKTLCSHYWPRDDAEKTRREQNAASVSEIRAVNGGCWESEAKLQIERFSERRETVSSEREARRALSESSTWITYKRKEGNK
jgi:hypothetical protein